MSRHGLTALIAAFTASTAMAQAAPDPAFCAVLQDFATSVRPGEAKEITFLTSWGPDHSSEKACRRQDDEPSVKLCTYLVKHGSAEYTGVTVKAALMCLSPKTHLPQDLGLERGSFSFSVGTPQRGARVEVVFGEDPDVSGKAFRLKARGY